MYSPSMKQRERALFFIVNLPSKNGFGARSRVYIWLRAIVISLFLIVSQYYPILFFLIYLVYI